MWLPLMLGVALLLDGCGSAHPEMTPVAHGGGASTATVTLRVATFNTSLNDDNEGGLIKRLSGDDAPARNIAAVIQRVHPDLILLNEFDEDPEGAAADLFQKRYLAVAQRGGGGAISYGYRYFAAVNTGLSSGFDLNGDGVVAVARASSGMAAPPETPAQVRARAGDSWGYGAHPGQYGMLVLSKYPLDTTAIRTFQLLRWSAMPKALAPQNPVTGKPWYSDQTWSQLRLSSKSHWDIPVRTPLGTVHFLVAHPTPPTFDGPEDRNGTRNHDEIRLWSEYLTYDDAPWLCDDAGKCGGLPSDASFVIAGDMNADASDGDGRPDAIPQLLSHPRVASDNPPKCAGAIGKARDYGLARRGDAATKTGDFGPKTGTLRLDYVLPSKNFDIVQNGCFWPESETPDDAIAESSDHHLIWIDLRLH